MGGEGNPPVVTLVEPAGPGIGDPMGAKRPFTAECDQPANKVNASRLFKARSNQISNPEIYIASVMNGSLVPPFGHAICAEHLGGDVRKFSNWKFFQFANLDIQPGDQTHMPKGTETEDTKVQIYEVIGIINCVTYDRQDPEVTFLIDKNGTVTPEGTGE